MFRYLSAKYFEPISMWVIILGIVCLCQPWIRFFHVYGFLIIIIGLVGFDWSDLSFFRILNRCPKKQKKNRYRKINGGYQINRY